MTHNLTRISVAAVAAVSFVLSALAVLPASAATDGQLSVLINGQAPGAYCIAGPITVSGSGVTGGQGSTWHLVVQWGDGSPDTTSDTPGLITSGSVEAKNSAFTYSTEHDFTSGSTSGLTVILYHVQESGQDGQVIVVNQCVAAPTEGVVVLAKHVVNDNGRDSTAADFSLTIGGETVTGNEAGTPPGVVLEEGIYAITEDGPAGYTQTGIACTDNGGASTPLAGSLTVVAGHNYVCTVTNNDTEIENTPPVITLTGSTPVNVTVNTSYTELGATALDAEDSPEPTVVIGGDVVNAAVIGTYVVTYNATDTDGAAAVQVTRTVNVVAGDNECNDGVDNDGDGATDFPADTGCSDIDDDSENTPPAIVLTGANPLNITLGNAYAELGALANDAEDGINLLVTNITGAVNTLVIGTYHVLYNFTDSDGAAAPEVDRTVNVVPGTTQCSDGVDNDGDGETDYPADEGCLSYSDDSENEPPVITVTGTNPVQLVVNVGTYNEEGATADDAEDGSGLVVTDIDASAVNTSAVGSYTVLYNFTDSDGAAAAEMTRTVNVVAGTNECNDTIDNDGDGSVDYPADAGCSSIDDTSENQPPVVIIDTPEITITLGGTFTPPTGVHATDPEDGSVTVDVVNNPVDTGVIGDYIVTYGATDSDGASAANETQTIHVRAQCADGADNDDDDKTDASDPGCWSNPNDSETYDPADNNETDAADVCSNIESVQTTVPEGMVENEGVCTTPQEPVDVCSNIEGAQATVPEGMTVNDGACSAPTPPEDDDGNISGSRPAGSVLGASTGQVLGESCGLYMDQYLKRNNPKNNPGQVTKLQAFLVKHGFGTFTPTGFFGPLTEASVKAFQVKYSNEVLVPWNIAAPTGLAYLTTLRQVNLIECPDLMIPVPALIDWNKNPAVK